MKKHIPNILSIIRLFLSFGILVLLFIPHQFIIGQILFVSAVVSDKLDGSLARLWKVESELGKKLESTIDPLLSTAGVLYILFYTDLPLWFFYYAGIALLIATIGRLWIKAKTGKLFYEKSQLTRYGVGLLYIIILLYLFHIPYREWVVWFGVAVGTVGFINYCRMMIKHTQKYLLHSRM